MRSVLLPVCLLIACSDVPACHAEDLLQRLIPHRSPQLRASRVGRFLFISDYVLDDETKLASQLCSLGRQLSEDLKIPEPSCTVKIYVFKNHSGFSYYVRKHIPYLTRHDTHRQALFLLRHGKPHIFSVQDAELSRNLRHEYVHVCLNSAVRGVPLWLDEGLAKYYEAADPVAPRPDLMAILDESLCTGWHPDLKRLESLTHMPQMGAADYAEAWCWVRLLMSSENELNRIIPEYLADAKDGRSAIVVSQRLEQMVGKPQQLWESRYHAPLLIPAFQGRSDRKLLLRPKSRVPSLSPPLNAKSP